MRKSKGLKNSFIILDSHGTEISHLRDRLVEGNMDDFIVTLLSKPGADLKHIIREGHYLAGKLGFNGFVIIMGGTNDPGRGEPDIEMKDLLSWCNILYQHDQPFLNENIKFLNKTINEMFQRYKGNLNILNMDVV